jgi:glycosyltransferase involved in cell wall biosynthesis
MQESAQALRPDLENVGRISTSATVAHENNHGATPICSPINRRSCHAMTSQPKGVTTTTVPLPTRQQNGYNPQLSDVNVERMGEKYILQYGSLAGWPFRVAESLRKLGVDSRNVIFYEKDVHDLDRRLPYDEALCKPDDSTLKKLLSIPAFINRVSRECSLVHYHSANIFFREAHWLYEGPILRRAGIPMVISFGGGDARFLEEANRNNPYFYRPPNWRKDAVIKARYLSWSRNIRFAATDPEMATYAKPYFEKIYTFRQPVNLDFIQAKYPSEENKIPVVLHIPTEPLVKGTDSIVAAVERLQKKGLQFKFELVRQLTQRELHQRISECDIYVDELRCGSHGVTAVEAMAAGKPTITYIRPDLIDSYPAELPLVNANPDTIEKTLEELILDPARRHAIGVASRQYVEKYHDANVVALDLLDMYDEIGRSHR